MKESISMTWILQIVILFILLFTAIMALTINNSNAFGMKDEILNIIEYNKGKYTSDSDNKVLHPDIVAALNEATYRTSGSCEAGYTGYNRKGEQNNSDAAICIREVEATKDLESKLQKHYQDKYGFQMATGDSIPGKYYQIVVFYQLELPVISQVYNFSTKGETRLIYK